LWYLQLCHTFLRLQAVQRVQGTKRVSNFSTASPKVSGSPGNSTGSETPSFAGMSAEVKKQLSDKLRGYVPWASGVALVASTAVASNWSVKMQIDVLQEHLDVQATKANLRFDRLEDLLKNRKV